MNAVLKPLNDYHIADITLAQLLLAQQRVKKRPGSDCFQSDPGPD